MTSGGALPPGAAVVAVGTELLAPGRTDRNTPLLKERLADLGVPVLFSAVVPDERAIMEETLKTALGRHRYVLVCGGLGPTTDDLTRFAAASVLGVRLIEDAASLASIEARFRNRGIEMPEVNRRQALIPEGAAALPNPAGTAPGVLARTGAGAWLVLLPGPPAELAAMFDAEVRPRLARATGGVEGPVRETLMVAGLPESVLQERILDLTPAPEAPDRLAILASGGEIEIRVTGRAGRAAEVRGLADRMAERLGPAVFSRTAGEHLEHAVGRLLERRGERAAFAESLTGGLITERLTRVPGSSAWFDLGVVAYANEAKRDLLGVPEAALLAHGAVSEAGGDGNGRRCAPPLRQHLGSRGYRDRRSGGRERGETGGPRLGRGQRPGLPRPAVPPAGRPVARPPTHRDGGARPAAPEHRSGRRTTRREGRRWRCARLTRLL